MKEAKEDEIYAIIDYEDAYVQPLLLAALRSRLPTELLVLIDSHPGKASFSLDQSYKALRLLQWRQYESIDFDQLLANVETSLANSYIIRKALIRKHYLSTTVAHWIAKHPGSCLKIHVKQGVEFEVDYAEFLDEALDQADGIGELRESWRRNAESDEDGDKSKMEKEWWILKPGMSERGQGIRLFSSEEELQAIFEEWDPPESDEDDEHEDGISNGVTTNAQDNPNGNAVMTSHLRHFVAQPYIHPPLLLASPHPCAGRKFHIRTYVLAAGALKVWVYRRMLALFAADPYAAPDDQDLNDNLGAHLTNTCLQSGEREGSVCEFWDLPFSPLTKPDASASDLDWRENVFKQICTITSETFEAAARTMSIHFQPLPNAFEVFGVDFLVDAEERVWLLEVNAFPDFAQTGSELKEVVNGLFEAVVDVAVKPFFGLGDGNSEMKESMVEVLDIDLGRR